MTTNDPNVSANLGQSPSRLAEQAEEGKQAWRQFGLRLRSVTPTQLVRFLLVAGALILIGWLVIRSWQALIPFVIGATLAYLLLPVVNALDRVMPRSVASLFSVFAVLAFLALFVVQLIPALALQFERFTAALPDAEQIQLLAMNLDASLEDLPDYARTTVVDSLGQTASSLRERLDNSLRNLPGLVTSSLLNLINIVGALIGLIALPIWILMVLSDQRKGRQEVDRLLDVRARGDFWAVVRILDRSFRAFVQRQVTQGILVGFFMFLTLTMLTALGITETEFPLIVALLVGLMELIPTIGPIIAFVALGLTGLLVSPAVALANTAAFVIIHLLVGIYVGGRPMRGVRDVHPVILVVAAVVLSEVGLMWAFLSVPVVMAFRDLVRYLYGRLSEPPRPAGLIPDEATSGVRVAGSKPATVRPVPVAYRHGRAKRIPS